MASREENFEVSRDLSPTITGATPKSAATWEDVAVEVTELVAAALEPLARKAADDIYERMMETAQDYLADNVRFNLSSRLEASERGYAIARKQVFDLGQTNAAMRSLIQRFKDHAISGGGFNYPLGSLQEIDAALTSQASGEG